MNFIQEILRLNLKRLRKSADEINQEDLAHASQVTEQTIKNYENGRSWPGPENIVKMAQALHCDPTEFFRPENSWPVEKPKSVTDMAKEFTKEIEGKEKLITALKNQLKNQEARESAKIDELMEINRELSDTIKILEAKIEVMKKEGRPGNFPQDVWSALMKIEKPAAWNKMRAVLKISRVKSRKEETG